MNGHKEMRQRERRSARNHRSEDCVCLPPIIYNNVHENLKICVDFLNKVSVAWPWSSVVTQLLILTNQLTYFLFMVCIHCDLIVYLLRFKDAVTFIMLLNEVIFLTRIKYPLSYFF
ncbi:unnamed protein product [Trichobilharzia szidati]|nr:unnamed protein product [Trichobilharzia szidati]